MKYFMLWQGKQRGWKPPNPLIGGIKTNKNCFYPESNITMNNVTKYTKSNSKTPPSADGGWGAVLLAFIHKEFLHVFRDKRTLLIMFGLPIAQILIFGYALTNEVKNARLLVVEPTSNVVSKQLIQKIDAGSYFTVTHIEKNTQNLEKYFKNGEAQCAVIFPENFLNSTIESSKIQIITDATDPNFAKTVINYLSAIIMDFIRQPSSGQQPAMTIKPEVRMLYNPSLSGTMNFVPGVIAMIMMIVCTTLASVSVVREKETGTMEVLLVSPVRPIYVLISKAVPYFVLSVAIFIVVMLISNLLMGVPIRGSLTVISLINVVYILTCLAFGLMISNITSSQSEAILLSVVAIMLPILLFTGFIFPLENMPLIFQWFANIIPARWYFLIIQSVMLKGMGLTDVWMELAILLGMMVLLLAISLRKYKIRLE